MNISPVKVRARKYAWFYLVIILFIFSFGSGFLIGGGWYVKKQISNASGEVELAKVLQTNRSLSKTDKVDFNLFWQVWDEVKQKYAKQPVDEVKMFYGSMQGMVWSLGDPYSMFFPPEEAKQFADSLSGEFEGIGAEIGLKQGLLTVVSPLPESPAIKAGLRPGDIILAINGEETTGMDANTAITKIRGKKGTEVKLKIARGDNKNQEIKEITIIRDQINVPSVMYEIKKGDIAYLRIMQFNEKTSGEIDRYAAKIVEDKNIKGIILDLRNNPGGYLDAAIDMSSEWLKTGDKVVGERDSKGEVKYNYSFGPGRLGKYKTVILVNGGSASASEIVAGALHDNNVAILTGEKTFGKGSVQDFQAFSDGSALKITVAEWLTPNGLNINTAGITPDTEVKEDWDKEAVGEDVMIDKALEIIRTK